MKNIKIESVVGSEDCFFIVPRDYYSFIQENYTPIEDVVFYVNGIESSYEYYEHEETNSPCTKGVEIGFRLMSDREITNRDYWERDLQEGKRLLKSLRKIEKEGIANDLSPSQIKANIISWWINNN